MTRSTESLLLPEGADAGDAGRIAEVAGGLRAALAPLVEHLAGSPPRPVRLTRGPGLDKTLASRLVQAARATSDGEFLHVVPSPTGLRMLLSAARGHAGEALLAPAEAAVERFQSLLDGLPGGRQALDAQLGERSRSVREKREHIARQAAFKSQSFLFGHYCETLATSLFLLPSATAGMVDMIEVHRRIALRRLTPATRIPLLSTHVMAEDPADAAAVVMTGLAGGPVRAPADFLLAPASSAPLPALEVEQEGPTTTFLLGAGGPAMTPVDLTTAFRMLRVDTVAQAAPYNVVRIYMLHTPCHTLVREVFLAPGLWPDAFPLVGFYLPGPTGTAAAMFDPGKPHYRQLNLTARIEQLPPGRAGFSDHPLSDQAVALEQALALAGVPAEGWRGWRCRMAYPVPLVEMRLALRFAAVAAG